MFFCSLQHYFSSNECTHKTISPRWFPQSLCLLSTFHSILIRSRTIWKGENHRHEKAQTQRPQQKNPSHKSSASLCGLRYLHQSAGLPRCGLQSHLLRHLDPLRPRLQHGSPHHPLPGILAGQAYHRHAGGGYDPRLVFPHVLGKEGFC